MGEYLPYKAEYAKSNRSKCKSCKTNIAQGTLRIAAVVKVNPKAWSETLHFLYKESS